MSAVELRRMEARLMAEINGLKEKVDGASASAVPAEAAPAEAASSNPNLLVEFDGLRAALAKVAATATDAAAELGTVKMASAQTSSKIDAIVSTINALNHNLNTLAGRVESLTAKVEEIACKCAAPPAAPEASAPAAEAEAEAPVTDA